MRASRVALAIVLVGAACGGGSSGAADREPPPSLERAIEQDLGTRLGAPVVASCMFVLEWPIACAAHLPDGSSLAIEVRDSGSGWDWQIDGRVVAAAPIEAYVRAQLADLGVAQGVTCGPALRRVAIGERVECRLEHGGAAFVAIAADGALSVELAIDPSAAQVRREPVTRARADALLQMSRALDKSRDDGGDGGSGSDRLAQGSDGE